MIFSKAVFLDRDGVINYPVLNPNTGNFEAPFKVQDLKLFPNVIESLKELQALNFKLFIITNQPDYAKGKAKLEDLKAIEKELLDILKKNSIEITEYFACFHHPNGVVPEYTCKCLCRKPGTLFLDQGKEKYNIDMKSSWMLGDRDTDIECGSSAGVKTILIYSEYSVSENNAGKSNPSYKAKDLHEAVRIIKNDNLI